MTESAAIAPEPAQTSATPPAATLPPGEDPTATPATPAGTTPPATAAPASDAPVTRGQARIEELAAERTALREAAEYWRTRALAPPPTSAAPAPTEKPAPKVADFESVDAWATAHAEWVEERAEQRVDAKVEQRLTRATVEREAAQTRAGFEGRVSTFRTQHPNFDAVVGNPRLPITQAMTEVIQASERGPELAYHLGMNPDKAARIAILPPAQQAAALGRLEVEISKPAPTVPKGTTRAPEPPTPVGGNQPTKDIGAMSIGEYLAHRKTWAKR